LLWRPAALFTPRPARAQDPAYDIAFAEAQRFEEAGNLAAAARTLEAILPQYPDRAFLTLQLAWTHFRAGHYKDAEGYYRRTITLSPGLTDARLGLAWSLVKEGRCTIAHAEIKALLEDFPKLPGAQEAEAACIPLSNHFYPWLSLTGHYYQDHPTKEWALTVAAGLDVIIRGHFSLGAAFRFSDFTPPGDITHGTAQYEGYGLLGYGTTRWGIGAEYAFLADHTGYSGDSHHGGLSARFSPWGEGTLDLAASFYNDATVLRSELGWKLPVGGGLSLRPAAAIQWAKTDSYGTGFLGTGMLTVEWENARGAVFLGGKYGEEFRPAYLSRELVMNIPERIQWGVWAGGRVRAGRSTLTLSYALDRLRSADSTTNEYRTAHYLTLSAALNF